MNHKDTPQPMDKPTWFKDDHDQWDRDWDQEDLRQFCTYQDLLIEAGRSDLAERFVLEIETVNPETLLNRMASRVDKLTTPKVSTC